MAEEAKDQLEGTEQQAEQPEAQETPLKDRISVDVEDIGTLRRKVKVTVPREVIDERLEKAYKNLAHEATIPGFRKGHAPRMLVEKRFGKDIAEEVRTGIVGESYEAAIEKTSLQVLGQPDIDVKAIQLPEQGSLEYSCEVEIKPEFELPSLEGVEVKKPKVEVADEDVNREVDRYRALRGTYQVVEDGAKADDMIVVDIVVTAEGQEARKTEGASVFARPRVIEGMTFENFGEVMAGAKAGDTRTLEGTLPEDYEKQELRGKKAAVQVTAKTVKRMVLPELTKEFLTDMGFESEDEMRKFFRDRLAERVDQEVRRAMRQQVQQYLLDNIKFDLPEKLTTRQADRAIVRRVLQLRSQGVPDAEIEKNMDQMKVRIGEQARSDLKLFFIMNKVAETLELEVNEGEMNSRIAAIAQSYGRRFDRVRDDMIKDGSVEALYLELRDEKSVDKILEKAKVSE